ncbi:GntR family transcriptional regulator [Pararhodobacter sp. CCB-MM2]|uniref:GntR family transcriptional regulator n=1 Tax=Pararhodobacter sp. CCB-MM2 TaxID=1786003 RepID=UPI000835029A|nr:GntR family transcriptional regulator [Pararhodobacter sp. CCB-MM2]
MENRGLNKIELQPTTLRDMVLERLRDAIIGGTFKPGERLIERVLCEQLGVSRTVVRETLRYLDAEGLVELQPNRGPIVARLRWSDARQIYDIRRMLETAAAQACAENMSPARERDLRAALAEIKAAAAQQATGDLFRATTRFYGIIFDGAGHSIAWEIVQRLNGRISRLRIMTLTSDTRNTPGPTHMQAICDAIARRDPEAARQAVEAHLTDAKQVAEKLLATEEKASA